ncbi:hypothetical protein [Cohnella yongneupensis]|uniref:Uncharacterized protein n=1 Tax=Cohnella yongneupensis TaxID=425006 RepID=A0ABW0R4W0_9BACL
MPRIPNFPEPLLEEHKKWHHDRHNVDLDQPPSGYGMAFLQFHRNFISRVLSWYNQSGNNPSLVEPWASVPEPIRRAPCYDQAAEARILFQPESFANADELGRFIESSGIHGCIHQEAAKLYEEPEINDFDVAPRQTVFYNIHGMINRWYQNWEGLGRFREGMAYWCGTFCESDDEVLYYREDGTWWLGQSQPGEPSNRLQASALEWAAIGDSRNFGPIGDGRPFRVWDIDGDGKLEVIFCNPADGMWREGKMKDGRLHWQPVRLRATR